MATIVTGEQYMGIDGKLYDIKRQLRQKDGYPFDLRRLDRALQAIVEGKFPSEVEPSTFQKLLAACWLGYVDSHFSEERFPLEQIAPDEDEWEVYEHHFYEPHFGSFVDGERALKELEAMRVCRLLNGPRRAMEFFARHHAGIQVGHPLIITGHWEAKESCDRVVPVFDCRYQQNELRLERLRRHFEQRYGWLVLRRKTATQK